MSTTETLETQVCMVFAKGSKDQYERYGEERARAASSGDSAITGPPANLGVLAFWHIVDYVLEFAQYQEYGERSPSWKDADPFFASTAGRERLRNDDVVATREIFGSMGYTLFERADRVLVFGGLESCLHTLCAALRREKEAMFMCDQLKPECHIVFLGNVVAEHPLCSSILNLVLILQQNNPKNVHFCVGKNEMKLMRPAALKQLSNAVLFQTEEKLVVCTNRPVDDVSELVDRVLRSNSREAFAELPKRFVASTGGL